MVQCAARLHDFIDFAITRLKNVIYLHMFAMNGKIMKKKDFLFCKELGRITMAKDVFEAVDDFLRSNGTL